MRKVRIKCLIQRWKPTRWSALRIGKGSPQEYKNVLDRFNEVITKFPKTPGGKLAVLYKGNIHLRLGEFDEAIKAYEGYLEKAGKEKLYRAFAMEGLGYSYEGKRDYEKARTCLSKSH